MDFRLGSNLVRSNPANPNNGGSLASETDTDVNKLRMYGSAFPNKDMSNTVCGDGLPPAKAPRSSPCGMAKASLQEFNSGGVFVSSQQIPSFSPLNVNASIAAFPFLRSSSAGCGSGSVGVFTQSQWMELEHQALIYKYITANVPIPSYLLNPIRKALESSGLSCFSFLRPNALGWGGFHLGFSKTDPEPGRCRRTDGKKWRCSRDAVADQKYCERHMNRGRHRSRKPVEAHSLAAAAASPPPAAGASKTLSFLQSTTNHTPPKSTLDNRSVTDGYPEFGSVCSDSLLNPLDRSASLYGRKSGHHPLLQFIDEWPESDQEVVGSGLAAASEQKSWVGGPLGEALHTAGECKALNLMEPLRGRGGAETAKTLNVNGLLLPSLPALLR